MNQLHLSAFISIFSELFPQFGASYFLPRNLDKNFYDKVIWRRIFAIIIVWTPILLKLSKLNYKHTLLAGLFIMTAFYLKRKSKHHTPENISSTLYVIGFLIILTILFNNCTSNICKINSVLGISLIFIGGKLIGIGRYDDICIDIMGRLFFTIGYLTFIATLVTL